MHTKNILISDAEQSDSKTLTDISFAAKRHWNYPEEYYHQWEEELVITSEYIASNKVYKAILDGQIIGYYSIVKVYEDITIVDVLVQKGHWLEHMFLLPEFHKKGIGRLLMKHAVEICMKNEIDSLMVFSDPFAKGFYEKVGGKYLYDSKSSIPGRTIPVFKIVIQ